MKKPSVIRIIGATAVVLAAAIVFWNTAVRSLFYYPETSGPEAATMGTSAAFVASNESGMPVRLMIPSLGVDAAVQDVGVNAIGNMRAPSNFTDVSWYEYGAAPGAKGSAVMAGHVDNGLALAGVFKHLSDLKPGDDLYVLTSKGMKLHFIVVAAVSYPYTSVPTDELFNKNDGSYLNLITCDGAWVAGQRTYDHRLVVFSSLASSS